MPRERKERVVVTVVEGGGHEGVREERLLEDGDGTLGLDAVRHS